MCVPTLQLRSAKRKPTGLRQAQTQLRNLLTLNLTLQFKCSHAIPTFSLTSALLEHNLSRRIRQDRQAKMLLPRLRLSIFQFQVIVHKKVGQDDFDLGRGEEPSRAGPDAVAEVDVVEARRRVLVFHFVAFDLAQAREAEGVEFGGVGVEVRVLVDDVAYDHACRTVGDGVAGGSLETFGIGDDSRDVDCVGLLANDIRQ